MRNLKWWSPPKKKMLLPIEYLTYTQSAICIIIRDILRNRPHDPDPRIQRRYEWISVSEIIEEYRYINCESNLFGDLDEGLEELVKQQVLEKRTIGKTECYTFT